MIDNNKHNSSSLPWYKDGLHFKCTECGKCCTGNPGYVWATEEEMAAIAAYLDIPVDLFKRKYTRQKNFRYSLIERKTMQGEYECVFLDGKKCKIYPVRPKQCRKFPWWKENLNSKESWCQAAESCEGINDQAPLVSCEEIEKLLES